jgi:type I restriction-modification system DNA methylase subunit
MAQTNANLIWKIADLLRGPYQPNQYGDVILPFTILRRLDCILEPTKDEVLADYKKIAGGKTDLDVLLKAKFKLPFYNTSRWTFASIPRRRSRAWSTLPGPRERGPRLAMRRTRSPLVRPVRESSQDNQIQSLSDCTQVDARDVRKGIDHRTAASRRSSASMVSRSRMSLTLRPLIDRHRPRNAAQIW